MATTTVSDLDLSRLEASLTRYNLAVGEWHDGGFRLYRLHGSWSRHFGSISEIEAWVREIYPEFCRDHAREVLNGIYEIVRMLDSDSADCDSPTAVVTAIRRLCEVGLRELEYLEMLQADARREARDERED